jgi:hypothetical protein
MQMKLYCSLTKNDKLEKSVSLNPQVQYMI